MLRSLYNRGCEWITLTLVKRAGNSSTQLFPALYQLQIVNSISSSVTTSTLTVSELINACGLSSRVYASPVARALALERSNSVLNFFQSCGFSQTQVKNIISKCPQILYADPQKSLKPKIDFLCSIGISEADVMNMVIADPIVLKRSIKNQLIPILDLLETLLGSKQMAVAEIKHDPRIFCYNISKCLLPNASMLQNLGVPKSNVLKFIRGFNKAMGKKPPKFSKAALMANEMGFDPSTSTFLLAVNAIARVSDSTWERKFENYRKLGFTGVEIVSMFKKQPHCMTWSEEKVRGAVEFFVNKSHWSTSKLSRRPNVLLYSLEKRIIPRFSVLQVLVSQSKIDKIPMVSSIVAMTGKEFLEKYVTPYVGEVPEVLAAYQGKLMFDEYHFQ